MVFPSLGKISSRLAFALFLILLPVALEGEARAQGLPVSFTAGIDTPLPASPGGTGCATASDLNGDGKLDAIICGNANNIWVLRGNGDGTFQTAATYTVGTTYPVSIAVADFNGDGKPDLFVLNEDSTVSVLLGNGDGTFQAQVVTSISANARNLAVVADFDGDGKADIAVPVAVPQHGDSAVAVLLSKGDGTFESPITSSGHTPTPNLIRVGDFNGDGRLDVVWGFYGTIAVFPGNGDGTVQQPMDTSAQGDLVAIGDFNADGVLDVANVDSDTFSLLVYPGKGDGTFGTAISTPADLFGNEMLAADFDGDGKPDLLNYGLGGSGVAVLLSKGDGSFQHPASYIIPGYVVATGDFNGDGRLDLISSGIVGPGGNINLISVALGKGDGGFLLGTGVYTSCGCRGATASSILVADLNGDERPDLVEVESSEIYGTSVDIALGNGDGTFQPSDRLWGTTGGLGIATNAAGADFNNDGKPDLAFVDGGYVGVLLGNGDGSFQPETAYGNGSAVFVGVGDFNRDGKVDIITVDNGGTLSLLLGVGDGTFGFATSFSGAGTSLVVGDFNHDGKPDVALNSGQLFPGNGDGTFGAPLQWGPGGDTIAVGDFNHDGNLDLVVSTASSDQVSVALGNGDGTFGSPASFTVGSMPTSVAVSDFNGDGNDDIAVFNSGWSDVSILPGKGDGTFQPPLYFASTTSAPAISPSIAAADLNGDGFPDVAVAGSSLLFNRPSSADASISPNALTFADREVRTKSGPKKTVLLNLGQAGLTISRIGFSGPQAAEFSQTNTCGSGVAAGASCTISVTFQPGASGTRIATLNVVNNGVRGRQTVALSGVGVSLGLGIAPGGSDSATVLAGQTANYTLTVGGAGVGGGVTLSCSGVPKGAACTFPGGDSIVVSATSASQIRVSVTTTSRSRSALMPRALHPAKWLWAIGILGLIVLTPRLGGAAARGWRRGLPLFLLLLVCSCGGGGSAGSQANPNGTPVDKYPLTVTAKSASITESVSLNLIVQ